MFVEWIPMLFYSLLSLFALPCLASESTLIENSSYKNLNPRPYDNCEANDLIKLSACCNDVLADLDDCKAGDLACECCALQHMDAACYNLCPGNPSTNFLSVLFSDCASLNDVNACNIPFKRVDGDRPSSFKNWKASPESLHTTSSSLKSSVIAGTNAGAKLVVHPDSETPEDEDESEYHTKPRPRLNLISNASSATLSSSDGTPRHSARVAFGILTIGIIGYFLC